MGQGIFSLKRALFMIAVMGASLMTFQPAVAADAKLSDEALEGLKFRSVGPYRGGRSTTVVGVPSDPMTYYMGSMGGVWKTSNGGISWNNISDKFFGTASVGAVDVSLSDPNVVVVGMGESPYRHVASSYGDGVYISTDAGKTWKHAGLKDARQISSVRIHPTNPDIIMVAVQGSPWAATKERGVYKSTDGGKTWNNVLFSNDTSGAIDLKYDSRNPRIIYASLWDQLRKPWGIRSGGPGSSLYKSVDGGDNWEKINEGLPGKLGKMGIAPSPAQDGLVYAIVEAEDTAKNSGLYKSADGGKNWKLINKSRQLAARSWYYMHIFADPNDADTVYVMNAPFMKSTNGGKSFSRVQTPHGDHHYHWINPDNSLNMINANDGGATVTFDGGKSWSTVHNQPTAQIYRVNTDNMFIYNLYGGQQDNSSISIPSQGTTGRQGRNVYHPVSGCESAHVGMDRDNPRYIYAGCYLGQIGEYDSVTKIRRSIDPYHELGFGKAPAGRKYRWNWNAPIVVSVHDPKVIYHASNVLFKSSDRGANWEEVSPDLTRNEKDRQGDIEGTITSEVSDSYNTILAVTESLTDANVLWVGADDGRLSRTENGSTDWIDVTPKKANEGMVNSIEISPHDANTIYVATPRYKYNDHKPYIFKTTNNGKSWKAITKGIPEGAFVRVVREDPVRKGLLYAGTETGLYVSLNGGKTWQQFQRNLPVVPITDIRVHGHDLVMSTQGRAFWILDNLSPLRQGAETHGDDKLHLYAPEKAFIASMGRGGSSADIYFSLAEKPDLKKTPVKIEILDASGDVIRTLESDAKKGHKGGGGGSGYTLPAAEGLNKARWDFRTTSLTEVAGVFALGGGSDKIIEGHKVKPGTYTVRIEFDGETAEQELVVAYDPRIDVSADVLAAKDVLLTSMKATLEDLTKSFKAARTARSQAKGYMKNLDLDDDLKKLAKDIVSAVDDWEKNIASVERETFQDVLHWPDLIYTDLQAIYGQVDGDIPPLSSSNERRYQELHAVWTEQKAAYDKIISGPVADFNAKFLDTKTQVISLGK